MKLSPDCVRAVLLAVEECPFNETTNVEKLSAQLPEYSEEEIWYTCLKLDEGNLLQVETIPLMRSALPGIKQVTCLTYAGHEFLNSIRDSKHWKAAKELCKEANVLTLDALKTVAKTVSSAAISAVLQRYI